ncbi:formimidoylglutamate deiminase [Amnibacterium kyonggiense]|uniref:formimidoylglutamate deiminase n=1 Tax=Amnibacterium kyonggiense TaxID=595671 RepID=UPI001FEB9F3B|nr:formimidoylglutamate deiminase [Amnibacterium kyonggiense]
MVAPEGVRERVRLVVADGRIAAVEEGVAPQEGDRRLRLVVPGFVNAHSHAFHRVLRGRTHDDGGDFWRWREAMYRAAAELTPESYGDLASAVFREMVEAGWTAVGEFHYVHHRPDGRPYDPPHAMELALAAAAREVGIRLVLLDTCYLTADVDGRALEPRQRRFGDGDADGWLARRQALRSAIGDDPLVTIGAAIHSVRAVPLPAIARIAAALPPDVPLHVHVAEQPRETADFLARHGETPVAALDRLGVLGPRTTLVHGTHLSPEDVARIGGAGATVALCPTTEADLGDGIGPARALADAGARIALGSDGQSVIDPLLEMRGLEAGERLASGRRGRFTPRELLAAATEHGATSLGLPPTRFRVGDPADLVELDPDSPRTRGAVPAQLVLTATASDVRTTVVAGREVHRA